MTYSLHGITFNTTEEGAGAFHCFNPERPEANDLGPDGMVEELRRFLELTKDRTRLLDVGALFGIFSLVFTARPGTSAYAIEASPWAYPLLAEQCEMNPERSIIPLNLFAGETGREVSCTRVWKHVLANLEGDGERVTLSETSLDHLGLDVDVMKVDVEAYEVQVLRGARETIERCKPLLFLECHLNNLKDNGETPESLLALVKDLEYRMERLNGEPLESFDGLDMTRVVCWPA